jgi:hypothetical protein
MAEPTKDYRAWIRVRLTDDLLPSPMLSEQELRALLEQALEVGRPGSPIVSLSVEDPRR